MSPDNHTQLTHKKDTLVPLAIYSVEEEALPLIHLLGENNIPCSLRNSYTNRLYGWLVDMGGVRIEVFASDLPKINELLEQEHFELPNPEELSVGQARGLMQRLPFPKKWSIETRLLVFIFFLALVLALLLFLIGNIKIFDAL